MASSFSWTIFFKSPMSRTLCFGDSTLAKLNQVKLLCETEFCITKSYSLVHPTVYCCRHILYAPISCFCTHQVSNCHSKLVTTPSSSIDLTFQSFSHLSLSSLCSIFLILDKLKIEIAKDSLHHARNNGAYLWGELA